MEERDLRNKRIADLVFKLTAEMPRLVAKMDCSLYTTDKRRLDRLITLHRKLITGKNISDEDLKFLEDIIKS